MQDGADISPPRRPGGTLAVALALLGLLAAAGLVAWELWSELEGTAISRNGLIAMALGAGATLLLGVALMSLVFISSRRGFDDEAGKD